jgi:hypothetical protein
VTPGETRTRPGTGDADPGELGVAEQERRARATGVAERCGTQTPGETRTRPGAGDAEQERRATGVAEQVTDGSGPTPGCEQMRAERVEADPSSNGRVGQERSVGGPIGGRRGGARGQRRQPEQEPATMPGRTGGGGHKQRTGTGSDTMLEIDKLYSLRAKGNI